MFSRRGFTLVEVLVVIAIIGAMVGVASLSISKGVQAANLQSATRGVLQYVRHARATALLKNRPVVVRFEEINSEGEFSSTRMSLEFSNDPDYSSSSGNIIKYGSAQTLTGETVNLEVNNAGGDDEGLNLGSQDFEGVHIRVGLNEEIEVKSRVSVFSNIDFLLKQSAMSKKPQATDTEGAETEKSYNLEEFGEESGSVLYETNGRCDPYIITIWRDGSDPENGQKIKVDKFGKMKVVSEDGED